MIVSSVDSSSTFNTINTVCYWFKFLCQSSTSGKRNLKRLTFHSCFVAMKLCLKDNSSFCQLVHHVYRLLYNCTHQVTAKMCGHGTNNCCSSMFGQPVKCIKPALSSDWLCFLPYLTSFFSNVTTFQDLC